MDDRPHPLSIVGVIENPATKPRRHQDTKFLLFESLCLGGQRKAILVDTLLHRLSSVVYGLYAILGDEMKFCILVLVDFDCFVDWVYYPVFSDSMFFIDGFLVF